MRKKGNRRREFEPKIQEEEEKPFLFRASIQIIIVVIEFSLGIPALLLFFQSQVINLPPKEENKCPVEIIRVFLNIQSGILALFFILSTFAFIISVATNCCLKNGSRFRSQISCLNFFTGCTVCFIFIPYLIFLLLNSFILWNPRATCNQTDDFFGKLTFFLVLNWFYILYLLFSIIFVSIFVTYCTVCIKNLFLKLQKQKPSKNTKILYKLIKNDDYIK